MVQANCNKTSLLKMSQEIILYINIKIGEKWLCHQIAISEKADCQKVVNRILQTLELISIMNIVSHLAK